MRIADSAAYLKALLAAPRPGSEKILAFYDSRVNMICRDPALMLLPLDDHMCHRGDGLFESIAYRDHKLFALDAHLARLASGARLLGIEPSVDFGSIREIIMEVARSGGSSHGDMRVFLSRGPGGFGISPNECPVPGFYAVALKKELPSARLYENGLTAFASEIPPKQEYLARIKNTNYLPNVLMAQEAARKGMDVAVTFDATGHMGEAAIANVAIVDAEGRLSSPSLQGILPGTTLLAAVRLAAGKMPVAERAIHRDEIMSAREMLLFTSSTLCVGVTHFDGHPVGSGCPGPVAHWLREALLAEMLATGTPF